MNLLSNNLNFCAKNLYISNNITNIERAKENFEQQAIRGRNLEIIPTENDNEVLILDNEDAEDFRMNLHKIPKGNKATSEFYYNMLVSNYRYTADKTYI